ncbi:MAG: hypothetical protein C0594_08760, partial [Marinilabiliales bacterium]
MGSAISTAGDINGDGFSDIIIASGNIEFGIVRAYYGSASGLSSSPNWEYIHSNSFGFQELEICLAGDVNDDGYSDIAISAPYDENGESNEGIIYLFYGSSNGLTGSAQWTYELNIAEANLGISISSAGDVNGDGYSDLLVGQPNWNNSIGKAYVFYGSSNGMSELSVDELIGAASNSEFSSQVSYAGDVNHDGYSDIVISAPKYSNGESLEGKLYAYYGSSTGIENAPSYSYESDIVGTEFGSSLSSAGDFNADGYADVLVGSAFYTNGQNQEGEVLVICGSETGLADTAFFRLESNIEACSLGASVSVAGDVNGDGIGDIMMSARNDLSEGQVYLFNGNVMNITSSSSWLAYTPNWYVIGDTLDGNLGYSVESAGDVNGDGFSDVILGSYFYSNGESHEGKAYIYLGSENGLSDTEYWSYETDYPDANFGVDVSPAGDVNGDGYSDVIVGAS